MQWWVGIDQFSRVGQFYRSADSGVYRSDYSRRRTKRNEKLHIFPTSHVSLCKIKFHHEYLDALFDP